MMYGENPWTSPPASVVQAGLDTVIRYWLDVRKAGQAESWKLKVVLVGAAGVGKTSLTRSIVAGESRATGDQGDVSTVGICTYSWKPPLSATTPLEMVLWDFAGQHEYYAYHQLFLTHGALYLLVVNLCSVDEGRDVTRWLDALLSRVPDSVTMLVGTHSDLVEDAEEAMARLRELVDTHLARQKEVTERGGKSSEGARHKVQHLRLLDDCAIISSVTFNGVESLRKLLPLLALKKTHEGRRLFPDVGAKLPLSWVELREQMKLLQQRADTPILCLPKSGGKESLLEIWKQSIRRKQQPLYKRLTVRLMQRLRNDLEETMNTVLLLGERAGDVLVVGVYVHLNPCWLMEMVKPLADHKMRKRIEQKEWVEELSKLATSDTVRMRLFDLQLTQSVFIESGLLNSDYLRCLWRLWDLHGDAVNAVETYEKAVREAMARLWEESDFFYYMQETLTQHGVLIPVVRGHGGTKFAVPARWEGGSNAAEWSFLRAHATNNSLLKEVFKMLNCPVPAGALAFLLCELAARSSDHITCRDAKEWVCGQHAARILIDRSDVLVTVGAREVLCYVTSSNGVERCRAVLEIFRDTMLQVLQFHFPGLQICNSTLETQPPSLAMDLGLLDGEDGFFQVFLSHAGPQKWGLVYSLHTALWNAGITAFMDRENLPPSGDAAEIMVKAARDATVGVVVLTADFLCRHWPLKEAEIFLERGNGCKIVPLFFLISVDDCNARRAVLEEKYPQVKKQWTEWENMEGKDEAQWPTKWMKVLQQLKGKTGIERDQGEYDEDFVLKAVQGIKAALER
ncbi:unnamed protein product [Chrysoparadoxa australica]